MFANMKGEPVGQAATMVALYRSFQDWFWEESFWLPENITWDYLQDKKNPKLVQAGELYLCLPIAVVLIILRVAFERLIDGPFVKYLGVKDKKIHFTPNPFCEEVYLTISKFPAEDRIVGLSKQLGWTSREVERWFRHRCMHSKPSLLKKVKESSWRFLFYTVATVYGFCILYKEKWLWNPAYCFIDYKNHVMSEELFAYYVIELGFYVCLTISQFVDVQRKDFWQMVIHHIVTILLLCFSYATSIFRIGAVIVLLHDVSDVPLEAAKMAKYAKLQRLCDFLFAVFAVTFLVTRLIIFPIWVIYPAVFVSLEYLGAVPSRTFFIILLLLLQILHVFWGWSIMAIAYRLASGKDAKDIRSDEESSHADTTGTYHVKRVKHM